MCAVPRFTRAVLESFHGAEVPDLVGPGVRLVFVGINPDEAEARRPATAGRG